MSSTFTPGQSIGAYKVIRELGSGGMGRVYLASPRDSNDENEAVAVKVVHRHLLERAGFFKRFLREAEVGKSVRHPNVVRTLDVDAVIQDGEQVNFLVTEYVEGRTLRSLLDDYGTLPDALLREIAVQVTRGLVAIHEQGIVHRDLKPENVLITEDDQIRIMDLGVAHLQEVSARITGENEFMGSLTYGAPEQFRSEPVGPSADLYSLGVLMLELLTGKNPFHAESSAEVITAHLGLVPQSPRQANPKVSEFLDELVMVLLAKTPANRFPSSEDLYEILEQGEGSSWWQLRKNRERQTPGRLIAIDVDREVPFHGRARELKTLNERWAEVRRGRGGVMLIEGEAGFGRTRLLDAFVQGLPYGSAHILYGSYGVAGGLGALSDSLLGFFSASGLQDGIGRYLDRSPGDLAGFAALVEHAPLGEAARAIDAEERDSIFGEVLQSLASEKPVLWVLEDVQFASDDSLSSIHQITQAASGSRALVVLTCAAGLDDGFRRDLAQLPALDRMDLVGLTPREVVQFLQSALGGQALADKLGSMIAYKSDGVPQAMLDMINAMTDGALIRKLPDGSYVEVESSDQVEVSHAVHELMEARLEGLSDKERTLLDVAAVQGFEFDAETIARVCGLKRVEVLRHLADLERRGLIVSKGQQFRFDQQQLQQHLYQPLPPALAGEYHWLIAQTLARQGNLIDRPIHEIDREQAFQVLRHALRSARPESFLHWLVPVLQHLRDHERYNEALDLADHVLGQPGLLLEEDRAPVLLHKAACANVFGDRKVERACIKDATDAAISARNETLLVHARTAESRLLLETSRGAEAQPLLQANLEYAVRKRDTHLEAMTSGMLGVTLQELGENEQARIQFERQLELAGESKDERMGVEAAGHLGDLFMKIGMYDVARNYLSEQLTRARSGGFRKAEAAAQTSLGLHYLGIGEYEQAQKCLENALEVSSAMGYRRGEAVASGGLGQTLMALGRFNDAEPHIQHCLSTSRQIDDLLGSASGLLAQGRIAAMFGDFDRARASFLAARERCEQTGNRRFIADVLHELGWVEHRRGDAAGAGRLYLEALGLRRETGDRVGGMETLVRQAGLQMTAGHEAEARQIVDEVLALGRDLSASAWAVLGRGLDAMLPGGDAAAAERALAENEQRLPFLVRLEAEYVLWRATNKPLHLRAASRLLEELYQQSPPELRGVMREQVRLYRDIDADVRSDKRDTPDATTPAVEHGDA